MKRLCIMALAALLPMAAAAQNRAIEALAEKYSGREGFTTTVLKGRITGDNLSRTLDIRSVDISSIMRDISAIVVVSSDEPDAEFARDARAAAASTGYATVLSQSSRGRQVSFLVSENGRGRPNEFVIVILGDDANMLLSLVGDYKLTQIDKTE